MQVQRILDAGRWSCREVVAQLDRVEGRPEAAERLNEQAVALAPVYCVTP